MAIRKALVTGASGGIGQAIALKLARMDIHVWIHYHKNETAADSLREQIHEQGGQASTISFDVANGVQCQQVLEDLLAQQEIFEIVVLNAGYCDDAPFAGMKPEQWMGVIDTSLNSFYHVTRPLIMPMIRNRWGRIVSIASIAALHGSHGQSNYAAAKAGLIGASRSLAREVASRGVCVNVVAPGFIQTPMIENVSEQQIKQVVPMKRTGTVQEVADIVAFLCTDSVSYVTGEVINVSGGIV